MTKKRPSRRAGPRSPAASAAALTTPLGAVDLYAILLAQLNRTVLRMTSAEFDQLLQRGTVADRQRAARELLDVQQARLALGNAVLADLAQQLKANEREILAGVGSLDQALGRLEKVGTVLETIGRFLKLVSAFVSLA